MKTSAMRTLPLALSLALAFGVAAAQTSSSSGSMGSSASGGQAAPHAQPATGTTNSKTTSAKLARADRKFMDKAAADGMYEVQVGQLASTKASDPNVKSLGDKLVHDHTAANKKLMQLASSKGVELPAGPTRGERREIEKLSKQTGSKFDDMFARAVAKDHQKDIKEFQKASGKVKDADLKAWIDKTLPGLREHLALAEKLPESGNNPAAMGNRGAKKYGTNTGK